MEILITETINIHKEETRKSVEALTGRGGKKRNESTGKQKEFEEFLSNETPPE